MEPKLIGGYDGPMWMTEREYQELRRRVHPDRARSLSQWSTSFDWTVYPSYSLDTDKDGVEVIKYFDGSPKTYYPMAYPSLPFELAKVEFDSHEGALDFVRRWGCLGFRELAPIEKARVWEPIGFVWHHAKAIRQVLGVYEALSAGDYKALNGIVSEIAPVAQNEDGWQYREAPWLVCGAELVRWGIGFERDDAAAALTLMHHLLSGNISGVHPVVFPNFGYRFDSDVSPLDGLNLEFEFMALTEAIWLHLAQFVTGKQGIARCRECGHYFKQTDKRQEFCPPPEDHVIEAKHGTRSRAVSLCATKFRSRQYRERKRR